jgi:hypothetical protein
VWPVQLPPEDDVGEDRGVRPGAQEMTPSLCAMSVRDVSDGGVNAGSRVLVACQCGCGRGRVVWACGCGHAGVWVWGAGVWVRVQMRAMQGVRCQQGAQCEGVRCERRGAMSVRGARDARVPARHVMLARGCRDVSEVRDIS